MAHVSGKLVTVFGGSGFVGRYVVRALAKRGWRVRAAMRRPDLAGHLQPLGAVGQIHAVQANLRYRDSVARACEGADAVVNLVAILAESGAQTFDAVHQFGARAVAQAASDQGISNVVHVSAIGADAHSPSSYARTKAGGEEIVKGLIPSATIVRPSLIFGPEDQFFNRFASIAAFLPAVPVIGGATKFQPVYVADVGEAIAKIVDGEATSGLIYELGGPEVASFRQCLELMLTVIQRTRFIAEVPMPIAKIQAQILQYFPKAPLTPDQLKLLAVDNVVSSAAYEEGRTLAGLGIEARTMEAILPSYLSHFRPSGEFSRNKKSA